MFKVHFLLVAAVVFLAQCTETSLTSGSENTTTTTTASQQTQLNAMNAAWAKFDDDFSNNRIANVINVLPPRLVAQMASDANVSTATLRQNMIGVTKAALDNATVHRFSAGSPRNGIQTVNGLTFTVFPTEVDLSVGSIRQTSQATVVGLVDNGKWYFARITDPRGKRQLVKAYPQLRGQI